MCRLNPPKRPAARAEDLVMTTPDGRGALFWVYVVPGSSSESVLGWQADGRLRVRIGAPPERGRANKALVDLLAKALAVKKSAVTIVSGATSRRKRLEVEGVSPERILELGGRRGGSEGAD
jgi:uncharacterized protein (TIGR00251 family)